MGYISTSNCKCGQKHSRAVEYTPLPWGLACFAPGKLTLHWNISGAQMGTSNVPGNVPGQQPSRVGG